MRTIIQHIGPLYGELNTGSVFGQPNGSIAVSQNLVPTPEPIPENPQVFTISSSWYGKEYPNFYAQGSDSSWSWKSLNLTTSSSSSALFNVESVTSDITDIIKLEIATDTSFENVVFSINAGSVTTGLYNPVYAGVTKPTRFDVSGNTYYIRLAVYSSSGVFLNKYSNTLTRTSGYRS